MAATEASHRATAHADPTGVKVYGVGVSLAFLALLVAAYLVDPEPAGLALVCFVVVAAAADALRISLGPEMTFALSLPVVLAAGMVMVPWQAATVGFLGTFDGREMRREVPLSRAIFNRSLVGLCALCSSAAFHALGGNPWSWPEVLLVSLAALAIDVLVNATLVAWPVAKMRSTSIKAVLARLFEPNPLWSAVRYACTGLMAPLLASAWLFAGVFGLAACLLPIALAWLSFRQAQQLANIEVEVAAKNRALAAAVEETAAERSDERRGLAGALHDEVLPALYKVYLMGEVIRHDLAAGRLFELEQDVDGLLDATGVAQRATRQVIGGLRSPSMGSRGLAGSIDLLAAQLGASGAPKIVADVELIEADETVQVVAYQVLREAMTNASKYARASEIVVSVAQVGREMRLSVDDDGCGFDALAPAPEPGHFGVDLMRERVHAVGGRFNLTSVLGRGTSVSASIPLREPER